MPYGRTCFRGILTGVPNSGETEMTSETMEPPMAKKQSKTAKSPDNRKPLVIQVRGSEAWKAWVDKVAEADGRPLAALVERALIAYAKTVGVDDPMPKR